MSKKEAYYEMTKWQHVYTYGESYNDFLERAIERIRLNGESPFDCARLLHRALESATKNRIPQKE